MIGREFSRLSRSINSERGTVPGRIIGLRILDASRSKPGYGKTTLLSQWAERNGQAFACVSVDETDNDPKMLLSCVAEALDRVEPIAGRVFEALASPGRTAWLAREHGERPSHEPGICVGRHQAVLGVLWLGAVGAKVGKNIPIEFCSTSSTLAGGISAFGSSGSPSILMLCWCA